MVSNRREEKINILFIIHISMNIIFKNHYMLFVKYTYD